MSANGHISVSGIIMAVIAAVVGVGVNFVSSSLGELAKATAEMSAHSVSLQTQVSRIEVVTQRLDDRLREIERQVAAMEYRERKSK